MRIDQHYEVAEITIRWTQVDDYGMWPMDPPAATNLYGSYENSVFLQFFFD
jgi:hypothetical protein